MVSNEGRIHNSFWRNLGGATQQVPPNATYRVLRAFGHPAATCCDVLGVIVRSNLTICKLEPTTPNMLQHVATEWPNARDILRPTMLRYVAFACCDRLAFTAIRAALDPYLRVR